MSVEYWLLCGMECHIDKSYKRFTLNLLWVLDGFVCVCVCVIEVFLILKLLQFFFLNQCT